MKVFAFAAGLFLAAALSLVAEPAEPATQPACKLSYRLSEKSENWDAQGRERITKAMDEAVAIYNANGRFDKVVTANHSPGTPTADANFNGWINFGGQIGTRTAMHEIAHTLGVGTVEQWRRCIKDGKWTGEHAIRQLQEFDGPAAVLHADRIHFWPYGLNYDNEGGEVNMVRHVKMVAALRQDMGLDTPANVVMQGK